MKTFRLGNFPIILGIALLAIGLYGIKSGNNTQSIFYMMSYICIGFGCGFFGHGMDRYISGKALKNNIKLQDQIEIEKNDERNITIADKSKAKDYDLMIFVYWALVASFAIMKVDVKVILMLVSLYLFIQGYAVFYRIKYEKEM